MIEYHGTKTYGNPKQGKWETDLTVEIKGDIPVIPYAVIPVGNQPCQKLHRCDDQSSQKALQQKGKAGPCAAYLSQQQKTCTPGKKHTDVAAASPQKLQPYIPQAANDEKEC